MHKHVTYYVFIILQVVYFYSLEADGNLENDIAKQLEGGNDTSLSRTKRYLVFPEGSSFQLVFDLAYPSIDGIGLYVFGNTAAMAWELPSTPIFLDKKYKKEEEPEPTTTPLPHLEHPEEYEHHDWQPPLSWNDNHKADYHVSSGWHNKASLAPNYDLTHNSRIGQIDRSPVSSYSNPFESYAKKVLSSNYESNRYPVHYINPNNNRGYSYRNNPSYFWNRRTFHDKRNKVQMKPINYRSYGNTMKPFDSDFHHNIHRRTRRELYKKLEEFFSALIKEGKSCVLKMICQVNKTPKQKGTLWEELLKTIFKAKPDDFYDDEDHYDRAANQTHNCVEMYPECEGNILNKVIRTVINK